MTLKPEKLLSELLALAEQLGLDVRQEKGDFKGGYCRVDENRMIILNEICPIKQKNAVLAKAIAKMEYDKLYMLPAVREVIEKSQDNALDT